MLDRKITFTGIFNSGRVVVPKFFRWLYKLEGSQLLKVSINLAGDWSNNQIFPTKIRKDGKIGIPKAVQDRLKRKDQDLQGCNVDITLEPA
jgi:hypothetical protein